jgi:hypothetical protein
MISIPGLGGLGGGLLGRFRQTGTAQTPASNRYRKTLLHSDFTTSDVTLGLATVYTIIGTYTIPAQTTQNLGWGSPAEPLNQGFVYIDIEDTTGTDFEGLIKISIADANSTREEVWIEARTELLRADVSDRNKAYLAPEVVQYRVLGRSPKQDDKIKLYMKPDTASKIVDYGETTIRIDTTAYPQ